MLGRRKGWVCAIAALALLASVARAAPSQAGIVPQPVAPGELPWVAAIMAITHGEDDTASWERVCAGTVVAPTWVLTSARCGAALLYTYSEVYADHLDSFSEPRPGHSAVVAGVVIHPEYRRFDGLWPINTEVETYSANYDVALLRLGSPLTVPPIRVAITSDDALEAPGTSLSTVGRPLVIVHKPRALSNDGLTVGKATVLKDGHCAKARTGASAAGEAAYDSVHQVCTASKDVHCSAGSPLFSGSGSSAVQVGVSSYGLAPACAVHAYTELNSKGIRGWIRATAGV